VGGKGSLVPVLHRFQKSSGFVGLVTQLDVRLLRGPRTNGLKETHEDGEGVP
jgi:hypothetical protein